MKHGLFLACLLIGGVLAKEKQIKLEDIERENLANERKSKGDTKQYLPRAQSTPQPKMQYGFVPIKTSNNYQQQQYVTEAYPQDYVQYVNPQQYSTYIQNYQQREPQQFTQPESEQQYQQYQQPKSYNTPQAYTQVVQQQQEVAYQQPKNYQQPKEYYVPQYVQQPQYQQVQYVPQQQPQQHQQIQYIVDNQIQQTQSQPQKYYTQYVYLQPVQASSNNVQSVADTKGNVQYVMYVPANYLKGEPNYETVYQPEETYTQPEEQQYIQEPQKVTEKPKYSKPIKHQPTSLLDSYVPSYLQYQYYKQQQESVNGIKQTPKITAPVGKAEVVKTYRIQDQASHLNYRLHHPPTYLPHSIKQ